LWSKARDDDESENKMYDTPPPVMHGSYGPDGEYRRPTLRQLIAELERELVDLPRGPANPSSEYEAELIEDQIRECRRKIAMARCRDYRRVSGRNELRAR
jgi:hypothetical protein